MSAAQVMALLLALSVAGNAFLGRAYLGQRDTAVQTKVEYRNVEVAATACSESIDNRKKVADKRHVDAKPAIAAAAKQAEDANKEADRILSTPATVQGDDCKSAQDRVSSWWLAQKVKP